MHCELVKPYHLSDSFALSTTKEMLTPQNMIVVFKEDNKNTLMSKIILLMTIIIVKDYDILILFLFKLTRLKSTQKVFSQFFNNVKIICIIAHLANNHLLYSSIYHPSRQKYSRGNKTVFLCDVVLRLFGCLLFCPDSYCGLESVCSMFLHLKRFNLRQNIW